MAYALHMKLAYITREFPFAYLGETFLGPESRLLCEYCEEVHVIAARPRLPTSAFGNAGTIDVRIAPFSIQTLFYAVAETFQHPLAAASAFRRLAGPSYSPAAKMKNIALFPKALAVARYVREKQIDHIHAHWMTTPATVAYVASMMTGIPWTCTAHAHDIFADNLLSEKAASAKSVRVISESNCRRFNELTANRYTSRARVVHIGVELPGSFCSPSNDKTLRILSPARLHPIKGHAELLEGLALLQSQGVQFRCDLAGDGELFEVIAGRIRRLGLDGCVTMRGMVEHRILLDEIQHGKYDTIVLTSVVDTALPEQFEGIPVALMEAMAAGVPCVATDTGSIPELINAQSGVLIRERDAAALATALARLAEDPALRRQLGAAARERVERHFNVVSTTRELYELISEGTTAVEEREHAAPRPVSKPVSIPAANANCSQGK